MVIGGLSVVTLRFLSAVDKKSGELGYIFIAEPFYAKNKYRSVKYDTVI